MNIRCHGCGRHFRVRQDRLPAQGARTRCPRCDEILVIAPPAPVAQEPAITSPPDGQEDLFELPAAELVPVQEDLFAVAVQAGDGRAEPTDPGAAGDVTETGQAGTQTRPGGLRGWLGRLFGRES